MDRQDLLNFTLIFVNTSVAQLKAFSVIQLVFNFFNGIYIVSPMYTIHLLGAEEDEEDEILLQSWIQRCRKWQCVRSRQKHWKGVTSEERRHLTRTELRNQCLLINLFIGRMLQQVGSQFPNQESTPRPAALEVQSPKQPLNRQGNPTSRIKSEAFSMVSSLGQISIQLFTSCIIFAFKKSMRTPLVLQRLGLSAFPSLGWVQSLVEELKSCRVPTHPPPNNQ